MEDSFCEGRGEGGTCPTPSPLKLVHRCTKFVHRCTKFVHRCTNLVHPPY